MTLKSEHKGVIIELYNKDAGLDLRLKNTEINGTLREILLKRNGLVNYKILEICQHHIIMDYKENSNEWHKDFGKILVEKHTMRRFCKEGEKYKMFIFPTG